MHLFAYLGPKRIVGLVVLGVLAVAAFDRGHDTTDPAAVTAADAPGPAVAPPVAPDGVIARTARWGQEGGGPASVDPAAMLSDDWYVVFDGSGSMASHDCSGGRPGGRVVDAKNAIVRFARALPPSANVGLYVFDNDHDGEQVPLGRGPANRAAFEHAIRTVRAGGGTPLGESLEAAYAALEAQARRQGGYGSYHVIVATDGDPDNRDTMAAAVDHIVASPIVLETIGFCIDEGHPLNRPGETVYHNAMNPAELDRDLGAILAETDAFADDGSPRPAAP